MTDRSLAGPDRSAWFALAVLSVAVLLGMSVWFAASAVAPIVQARWGLTTTQAGWLTALVQLGFVAGTLTAAALSLAHSVPSRIYFGASALLAASSNAALLVVPTFETALVTRFATGVFLAGVYPPAMKMTATWFRTNRGLAIGLLIGALTVGKALPYLVDGLGGAGMSAVVGSTSVGAAVAALLILVAYRDGPHTFPRRPFSFEHARTVLQCRPWRLATGGYLGHMWELYAFWAWISSFLAAAAAAPGATAGVPAIIVNLAPFMAIAVGGFGCVWGGIVADRIGYERLTIRSLAVSGACATGVGLIFGSHFLLVLAVVMVWGFFVIADSAQFSAAVTEVVPGHTVGTALTLQVALGFLLTMVTIQLVPALAESLGWRWAFPVLALGPAA
ncbi:MAG: MFS transporter [Gemmatimonadales bacterium]|nr:MAG: MFS transporter [Gemmatimonadales bacterium]